MLKTIIRKLKRKKIMTWTLMCLNWSVVIINVTLQLLYIYIYIDLFNCYDNCMDWDKNCDN